MSFKKFIMTALLSIAASSLLATELPKEINIAYVKAPFNLQNMVMKEQGLLEREFAADGVKINWHTITSGAKQAQAMSAGALDVSAVMNTASLLMANGAGTPVRVATGVAHPLQSFAILGKPGTHYQVKDLKGKKIVGPKGTVLHQLLIAALVKNGMKPTDVDFIAMDLPASLSAVISGHADAALLAASGIIKAQEAGATIITTSEGYVTPNLVLTVREGFAKDYPDTLSRIVKVHREALVWIQNNQKEAISLGAKLHGISETEATTLAQWSHFYDTLTQKDLEGLKEDQAFLLENKMMQAPVDINKLVLPIALQ